MDQQLKSHGMSKMEEAKNVKDEDKLYKYEGVLYSSIMSPQENLKGLENFEARPDDLLLVAYPKCGKGYTFLLLLWLIIRVLIVQCE